VWTPQEVAAGHGFAQSLFDNVGVQYGLNALLAGTITPAHSWTSTRSSRGATSTSTRWRTGLPPIPAPWPSPTGAAFTTRANNMHGPIIDLRGHDVEEIHHDYRSYVMRARLDRANGNHDNQVIWVGPAALVGDAAFAADALTVMDKWLAAIEKDTSALPYARKVAKDKPPEAHDLCTDGNGNEIGSDSATCATIYPYYAEPRMVAGEQFTGDTLKCQLKALNRADYTQAIALTDADWDQLQKLFPNGVCDYSLPSLGQQPTVPWMSYTAGPGGQPLPAAPVSQKF